MSHDTHQPAQEKGPKTPLSSAFWFVLVLVFLFIAAVNFVSVMSNHDEAEGHGGHEEATTGHEAHATEAAHAEEVHVADSAHAEAH